MGRTCGTHGEKENVLGGNVKERDHIEDVRVVGRMSIKLNLKL